jgi:hypothetical protein
MHESGTYFETKLKMENIRSMCIGLIGWLVAGTLKINFSFHRDHEKGLLM